GRPARRTPPGCGRALCGRGTHPRRPPPTPGAGGVAPTAPAAPGDELPEAGTTAAPENTD
ncbi:hypothetical protein, partial [Nocardia neocaledoniensis]|uniref:hypothetical protein n=1 Tax=Nocardia neocaledoniensis TaxID=236511 RepID=UPI002453C102